MSFLVLQSSCADEQRAGCFALTVIFLACGSLCSVSLLHGVVVMLEKHCTRTAQSSCGGCSRRVHKIEYFAMNIFRSKILTKILPF